MTESTNSKHLAVLMESEIEKAQIVMAVNNEIVEKLQRDAEKTANMKVDVLGPIVERIKAEHGLEPAEHFRDTITRIIDEVLDVIMKGKDQIHTETLKLTGDISSAPSIEADLGAEEIPVMDMEDEFATEDPALDLPEEEITEPVPADRELKESVSRRVGILLESKSGTKGKKWFDGGIDEMRHWVRENKDRIAKIHKLL